MESKLEWSYVDIIVLSRFVAITHSEDKVRQEGLIDCLPKPKRTTTLNS